MAKRVLNRRGELEDARQPNPAQGDAGGPEGEEHTKSRKKKRGTAAGRKGVLRRKDKTRPRPATVRKTETRASADR